MRLVLCALTPLLACALRSAPQLDRRKMLATSLATPAAALLLPAPAAAAANDAAAAPQQLQRTSADISSYGDATGATRAANLGAGSISGKVCLF